MSPLTSPCLQTRAVCSLFEFNLVALKPIFEFSSEIDEPRQDCSQEGAFYFITYTGKISPLNFHPGLPSREWKADTLISNVKITLGSGLASLVVAWLLTAWAQGH